MQNTRVRVEWSESRDREPFFVIAEKEGGRWQFWERSSWEGPFWYSISATQALIAHAECLAADERAPRRRAA